jgi:hypothetical protein
MVVRLVSFEPTSFPPFREIPDFDFGFAVNGQSENLRVAVGDLVGTRHLGKNGIRLWQLLVRLYLLCFFSR